MENASTGPAKRLYDTNGEKTFNFAEADDDGGIGVRFAHTFRGFDDELLKRFDQQRSVRLQNHGKNATEVESALVMAAVALWDGLVVSVSGYGAEGEPLPDNWRELVGADDKVLALNDLLFVETSRPEGKVTGRRQWVTEQENVVNLRCLDTFGEVETVHYMKGKTAKDVHDYERIRAAVTIAKKDLVLPPTMAKKAALYDRMLSRCEGYVDGVVPMHHKAAVITEYFESAAESLAKK